MDKSIYEKQKDTRIIQCLFAQRDYYKKAKKYNNLYFIIGVLTPCLMSVLKVFFHSTIFNNIFLFVSIISLYIIDCGAEKIKLNQEMAANIQQYIDVTLFRSSEFQSQNSRWTCPLNDDEITELVSKYPTQNFNDTDTWYEDYSSYPFYKQIYYCQRENIRWDHDLRAFYYRFIWIIYIAVSIVVLFVSIFINASIVSICSALLYVLPIYKSFRHLFRNSKADENRITLMRNKVDNILNLEKAFDGEVLIDEEIKLQNKIFDHRKSCVMIPEMFFKMFHKKYQKTEEKIAENIRNQQINKL